MAKLPRNLSRAALLSVASTVALSSCALPPREAWRKIHDDGLIAYIKYEMETPHHAAPTDAPAATKPTSPGGRSGTSDMVLAQRDMIQSLREAEAGGPLTAFPVAALPGYVRSPYTHPPRLVDVRGVPSGTTMVCPYTRRKFIVPGAAGSVPTPSTMLAQEGTTRVGAPERLTPKPTAKPKSESPRVEQNDKPAPSKAAEDKPVTSPSAPPVVVSTTPASMPPPPPPTPKPVQEIPYGEPVPGRPGYVTSPYAAKHQLVDVAGLPAGMEVKCPFTGKLFRVPMQDMASSKPVETVPPLADPTPDKQQKKQK
jgi:hypothetical protein